MWKRHFAGKLWLLGISLLLSSSCAGLESTSGYRVTMPVLDVAPRETSCQARDGTGQTFPETCTTLLTRDYKRILVELVAACIAFGGTDHACRVPE